MKTSALIRFALGLILGAALSFLAGCIYAYCLWNPPSNDWGNEKTLSNIFLAPFVLIILLILLAKFRYFSRVARARSLGRLGFAGVLLGAVVLPILQLSESLAARNASPIKVSLEQAKLVAEFADMGARLRIADSVLVETGPFSDQPDADTFLLRLAHFSSKPVFRSAHATSKPGITLDRTIVSDPSSCSNDVPDGVGQEPVAGKRCLARTNLADLHDWPTQGTLINISEYYPSQGVILEFGKLERRSDEPPSDLTPHFRFVPGSEIDVRQWCQVEQSGPFPFGRGIRWRACTSRLTLKEIGDGMFGARPQ